MQKSYSETFRQKKFSSNKNLSVKNCLPTNDTSNTSSSSSNTLTTPATQHTHHYVKNKNHNERFQNRNNHHHNHHHHHHYVKNQHNHHNHQQRNDNSSNSRGGGGGGYYHRYHHHHHRQHQHQHQQHQHNHHQQQQSNEQAEENCVKIDPNWRPLTPKEFKEYSSIRVLQNDLVYVVGLPSNANCEEKLRSKFWFGKFGKIKKIFCNKKILPKRGITYNAFVTFYDERGARSCIRAMNGLTVAENPSRNEIGGIIRATMGTTKYCQHFLKTGTKCSNSNCLFLHRFAETENTVARDELLQFPEPISEGNDVGDDKFKPKRLRQSQKVPCYSSASSTNASWSNDEICKIKTSPHQNPQQHHHHQQRRHQSQQQQQQAPESRQDDDIINFNDEATAISSTADTSPSGNICGSFFSSTSSSNDADVEENDIISTLGIGDIDDPLSTDPLFETHDVGLFVTNFSPAISSCSFSSKPESASMYSHSDSENLNSLLRDSPMPTGFGPIGPIPPFSLSGGGVSGLLQDDANLTKSLKNRTPTRTMKSGSFDSSTGFGFGISGLLGTDFLGRLPEIEEQRKEYDIMSPPPPPRPVIGSPSRSKSNDGLKLSCLGSSTSSVSSNASANENGSVTESTPSTSLFLENRSSLASDGLNPLASPWPNDNPVECDLVAKQLARNASNVSERSAWSSPSRTSQEWRTNEVKTTTVAAAATTTTTTNVPITNVVNPVASPSFTTQCFNKSPMSTQLLDQQQHDVQLHVQQPQQSNMNTNMINDSNHCNYLASPTLSRAVNSCCNHRSDTICSKSCSGVNVNHFNDHCCTTTITQKIDQSVGISPEMELSNRLSPTLGNPMSFFGHHQTTPSSAFRTNRQQFSFSQCE